jgi:hypothetical protein
MSHEREYLNVAWVHAGCGGGGTNA